MIDPVATAGASTAGGAPSAAGPTAAKPDAASRGFEQMLVEQLAQELKKTAGDTGNEYASLLPGALADAVEQGGGLGLDLGLQEPQS